MLLSFRVSQTSTRYIVLSGSYNWNKITQNNSKTNPKQIQNKPKTKPKQFALGLFQCFVHVKQNAETKQK